MVFLHEFRNDEIMENINEQNNDEHSEAVDAVNDEAVDAVNDEAVDAVNEEAADAVSDEDDLSTGDVSFDSTDDADDEAAAPLLSGDELLAESRLLTNDPTMEDPIPQDAGFSAEHEPPPPQFTPPPTPPPGGPAQGGNAEDRLVRDPNATFGGVLSGIAHRFGWDVSLTRLAFVVVFLISGGIALPAYLLAWLIIPRARFWPPVVRQRTRSLGARDIGIGLIALAVLVVVGIGSGDAAAVIIPLALIAGGMWLLFQNPREAVAAPAGAAPMPGAGAFAFAPTDTSSPMASGGAGGNWGAPQMPSVQPEPVQSRSRFRLGVILAILGVFVLIPVLIVGGVVAAIASGDIDVNIEDATIVEPVGVDGIPTSVVADVGEYTLDLSDTDLTPLLEEGADPLEVSIDMDAGLLQVILPNDLDVSVEAEIDAVGDIDVLGSNDDGITPEISMTNDDPDLILDLSLDIGEIKVTRVG